MTLQNSSEFDLVNITLNHTTAFPALDEPIIDTTSLSTRITQGFYIIIFIIGLLGNTAVLLTVFHLRKRHAKDYFILHLAVVDLLVVIVSLPFKFYHSLGLRIPESLLFLFSKIVIPLLPFTVFLSVNTLVGIAYDRYNAFVNPLNLASRVENKVIVMLVVNWLWSAVMVSPIVIVARFDGYFYWEDWPREEYRKLYGLAMLLFQFIVPLIIIMLLYIRIGVNLHNRKRLYQYMASYQRQRKGQGRSLHRQNIRIFKVFILVVVLFFLCNLPTHIVWLLSDFSVVSFSDKNFMFAALGAEILVALSSCLNPIVYGLSGMLKWKNLLKCKWKQQNIRSTNETPIQV